MPDTHDSQRIRPEIEQVHPGITRVRFGRPERFTPHSVRDQLPAATALDALPPASALPFNPSEIICTKTATRLIVRIPCDEPEDEIYGFGLDPGAYQQKGLRKYLMVCAAVMGKTGASHGPVPFYLSTRGYGVLIDTARIPYVHVARLARSEYARKTPLNSSDVKTTEAELYAARNAGGPQEVVVDIPVHISGVDVYLFSGPTMRQAVQRYNLFSGGGAMPPMWGLGMKYRTYTKANTETVMAVARSIREKQIPCDMIGLEPGWQTQTYSCSFVWSNERFPDPDAMVRELNDMGLRVNLWEHAYTHPSSPLFETFKKKSADYLVWNGLVPDFADPDVSAEYAAYHESNFVDKGITGFKLDECDRQPLLDCVPFNFPEFSSFPSGIDGEQMTQLFGVLQQRSVLSIFKKKDVRTWGDVRATSALASPLPFNLYSDAYSFDEYLRQLVNASFTGLLWSPEVRMADSYSELMNRISLCAFAPQMCLDQWFMPHSLWEQYEVARNKADEFLPKEDQERVAAQIRTIVQFRMSLIPYLYSAFHRYRSEGLPPVRSLMLDFPDDARLRGVDNQFTFGDSILVAPYMGAECRRKVIFPAGTDWTDFHTHQRFTGGTEAEFSGQPGETPLFVRDNTLLPIAEPVQHVSRDTTFRLTVKAYGDKPADFTLFEDDGETYQFEKGSFNKVTLSWKNGKGEMRREGQFDRTRYFVAEWEQI